MRGNLRLGWFVGCVAAVLWPAAVGAAPAETPGSAESAHAVAPPGTGGHAAASSHAEEAKPPLLSFDPGLAIWSIVVFVLLLVLLRTFAWKPILQALQHREEFIRDALERAKQDREASERNLKKYAEQLEQARSEAEAIVAEGRRDAEVVRLKLKEEAQGEAEAMLQRAKREIELARTAAVKDIYAIAADLATRTAGKILRREINAQEHERLLAESIEELAERKR